MFQKICTAIVFCFLLSSYARAGGNDSHMGQPASNHVLLEWHCGESSGNCDFRRTFPDGTVGNCASSRAGPFSCFNVPAGMVLIVTDVDWEGLGFDPGIAGIVLGIKGQKVFMSTTTANSDGKAGKSEHMTSGFVVGPTAKLEVMGLIHSGIHFFTSYRLLVRGYLVADK